jgi:hypothetical protein
LKQSIILILFIISAFPVGVRAQDVPSAKKDSILIAAPVVKKDTAGYNDSFTLKPFKPDPTRAVIYSAVFPGLGQIYNRKYWKLPIVYGGFLGCIYAITWNGTQHSGYKNAYNDFSYGNLATNSWEAYRPYSMMDLDPDPAKWPDSERSWFQGALKNKRDYFRRNRDLSYIITVGLYALCMIDAYVDAQLFDFDISPDLSLRIDPVIMPQVTTNTRTFGLQCSLSF